MRVPTFAMWTSVLHISAKKSAGLQKPVLILEMENETVSIACW